MKIVVLYIMHLVTIQISSINFDLENFDLGAFQFIILTDTTSDNTSESKSINGSYIEITDGRNTNNPLHVNYLLSAEIYTGTSLPGTDTGIRPIVGLNPIDEGFTIEFPSALD